MFRKRLRRVNLFSLTMVAMVCCWLAGEELSAHKPFKSAFTFHEHIRPIFLAKCGSCHQEGGVAPMSLLDYKSAYPWAESIKSHLVEQTMPPWQAEAEFHDLRHESSLSAKELDQVIDWASGQTPEGRASIDRAETGSAPQEPDRILTLSEPHVLDASTNEAHRWFALPLDVTKELSLRAIEIRPGLRSIVRSVGVYWDETESALSLDRDDPLPGFDVGSPERYQDRLLLRWVAGQTKIELPREVAYVVPKGSSLVLEIRYAKTWLTQGSEVSDQTGVGLFFSTETPRYRIRSTHIDFRRDDSTGAGGWSASIPKRLGVVNVMPLAGEPLERWELQRAVDGQTEPMVLLHQWREEWNTQYWFRDAITLGTGDSLFIAAKATRAGQHGGESSSASSTLGVGLLLQHIVPFQSGAGDAGIAIPFSSHTPGSVPATR